jgi:hypothetical protein
MPITRSRLLALLALAALPAAAAGAGSFFAKPERPCFAAGPIGYRLTDDSKADFVIRVGSAGARPDLVLQTVDDPATADFVLADGTEKPDSCDSVGAIRTIRIDPFAANPNLTIAIAPHGEPGAFKIYAHSTGFSTQDAAALFAVMWSATRKWAAAR